MNNLFQSIITAILLVFIINVASSQTATPQKEILIIGTMHQVKKPIKNSYKPLLKRAKKYEPEVIFVERPMPTDTLSLKASYSKFLAIADSLKTHVDVDPKKLATIQNKALEEMTKDDFLFLSLYYKREADYANKEYYSYLYLFGREGSPKPMGNENTDLTAKLAIAMNLKQIHSMDNKWYNKAYAKAWNDCNKDDRANSEQKNILKLAISYTTRGFFSALVGRYGMYTNSKKTQKQYHTVNSFRYRKTSCEPCETGKKLWDNRNLQMARNIGDQARNTDKTRHVVIVGTGHVVGLQDVLKAEYPDLKVMRLRDL